MKALVLSGGGAKGSYQLGVWKALRELNIKFDIITGTSVGALNGALIVQNSYYKAKKVWNTMSFETIFGKTNYKTETELDIYKMYGKEFIKNGGINVKELENLINKIINEKKFFNSPKNFGLITYNLTDKEPLILQKKDIKKDLLKDYLIASSSCFPAFQEKEIQGEKFIDGGYHDNLPINLAIDMGATEIIAVDLDAPGLKKQPKKKIKPITIKPRNKISTFLNFSQEEAKRNIKLGYNDTMKVFNKLEGNKYTFRKKQLEKNTELYLETYLHVLNKILKYKKVIKSFETLIKTEINIDHNLKNDLLDKLILRIMESTANSFNLDETKIYTHKSFNKQLKKKLKYYLTQEKTPKEIEIYKQIVNEDYKEIRTQALLNPIDTLKAIYLYTICEA